MNTLEFTRFRELDYAAQEAINTLCTNLTFAGEDKRVIMVTSSHAHEGKSFITLNIMRTLASLGHKVILLDMDLRRSQLLSRYRVNVESDTKYGVSHYLAGMCELKDTIYTTNIENASMIPVGREVSNSLALLSTNRLDNMLAELRTMFEFVLVDAPPVGLIVDAAEIAKHVDGVLIAVKYNEVSRRELAEAKQQLERAGCNILGAVLNEVAFDSLSSKRYYNKSYYSSYETISTTEKKKAPGKFSFFRK